MMALYNTPLEPFEIFNQDKNFSFFCKYNSYYSYLQLTSNNSEIIFKSVSIQEYHGIWSMLFCFHIYSNLVSMYITKNKFDIKYQDSLCIYHLDIGSYHYWGSILYYFNTRKHSTFLKSIDNNSPYIFNIPINTSICIASSNRTILLK